LASTFDLTKDAPVDLSTRRDSLDDIGRYCHNRLASVGDPRPELLSRRIAVAASGNFLYAKYVLDEAIEHHDLSPDAMTLPIGLEEIYRRYLERELVRAREKWEDRYRPLLG
jgi:hypothetical protein